MQILSIACDHYLVSMWFAAYVHHIQSLQIKGANLLVPFPYAQTRSGWFVNLDPASDTLNHGSTRTAINFHPELANLRMRMFKV